MGILKSILGLKDDESILMGILSGRGKAPAEDYPESSKGRTYEDKNRTPISEYHNCPNPNCRYTPDIMCGKCYGTGHVD